MNELLTTGQMIDRLKVGEVAESEIIADCIYRVEKRKSGSVMKLDIEGNETGHYLDLHGDIIKLKWRILPSYVSFEEAMKALRDGKTALFHHDDIEYEVERNTDISYHFEETGFTFEDLINGKWTIEEDNNESK